MVTTKVKKRDKVNKLVVTRMEVRVRTKIFGSDIPMYVKQCVNVCTKPTRPGTYHYVTGSSNLFVGEIYPSIILITPNSKGQNNFAL